MLPKQNRIPTSLVSSVMKRGMRCRSNAVTLVYAQGNNAGSSRFAFVVGTGVDKRATARNRVKRLMRESMQHILPSMVSGMDCILIGSRALVGKTQQDVEKEVASVLQKVRLLTS